MKILDKNGKLFGLVNIVDFLIAAAILLVIAGGYYKFVSSKSGGAAEPKIVEATIFLPSVRPQLAEVIKVGDRMVANNSYQQVTVKSVEIKPAFGVFTTADGKRVEAIDPYLKDIYVVVEGKTVIDGATINMGGQEIRIGRNYYVKSLTYEFEGTIIDVKIKEPTEK